MPATHVEIEAGEDVGERAALESRLVGRLLDAGHALAPAAERAQVDVLVTVDDDGATVVASQDDTRLEAVIEQPVAEVRYLEVVHRTLAFADALAKDAEPEALGDRVGLVFDESVSKRGELAVALLRQDLTVVPAGERAPWWICVRATESDYSVLRAADPQCQAPIERAPNVAPDSLAAAVSRQGQAIKHAPAPATTLDDEMAEAFPTVARTVRRPERQNPGMVRAGAQVGLLGNRRYVEPAVTGSLQFGRKTGAVGLLRSTFAPSVGAGYSALDVFLSGGMLGRLRLSDRFDLALGLGMGVLVHRFSQVSHEPVVEVDPQATTPLQIAYSSASGVGVDLVLSQSYSIGTRRYLRDDSVIWERPAYRVGASLGFHFDRIMR